MIEKLPEDFVKRVSRELKPFYWLCNHKIALDNGKTEIPSVSDIADLINQLYADLYIMRVTEFSVIESGGIEIRLTEDSVEIAYRKSFSIGLDGEHAIY